MAVDRVRYRVAAVGSMNGRTYYAVKMWGGIYQARGTVVSSLYDTKEKAAQHIPKKARKRARK